MCDLAGASQLSTDDLADAAGANQSDDEASTLSTEVLIKSALKELAENG